MQLNFARSHRNCATKLWHLLPIFCSYTESNSRWYYCALVFGSLFFLPVKEFFWGKPNPTQHPSFALSPFKKHKHLRKWWLFCPKLYRRQIDITTYQIRKIKADTSLCLFADDIWFFLGLLWLKRNNRFNRQPPMVTN